MLFIENPKEYQTNTFYSHFRAVEQRNLRKTRMASDKTTARICRQETLSNAILAAGACPGSAAPRLHQRRFEAPQPVPVLTAGCCVWGSFCFNTRRSSLP